MNTDRVPNACEGVMGEADGERQQWWMYHILQVNWKEWDCFPELMSYAVLGSEAEYIQAPSAASTGSQSLTSSW